MMVFYWNQDGKFQPESSKEYKTEKGAVDKMNKEQRGAVFGEDGTKVAQYEPQGNDTEPETPTEPQGNDAEPETPTEQSQSNDKSVVNVVTTCDILNIRSKPEVDAPVIGEINEPEGEKKEHAVLELENGWGQMLGLPFGYIQLAFTKRA